MVGIFILHWNGCHPAAGEHQALPGLIHDVVGARNRKVYFYNGFSTVLHMTLKQFMGTQL